MTLAAQKVEFSSFRASCKNCSLDELCLPRGLDAAALHCLDEIIRMRRVVRKGEAIFNQGATSGQIYAVRSGSIKSLTIAKDGEEQILGFHLPGELLGLDGLNNNVHSCSGVALDTSMVCELPINELHILCIQIPGLQQQLLSLISDEITKDHTMLLLLARRNAEQKLATFFINMSGRFKVRGYSPGKFELSMTRHDIGNFLGLADETVSRLITRFRENNLIWANRKNIRIIDYDRLCKVAEGEYNLQ